MERSVTASLDPFRTHSSLQSYATFSEQTTNSAITALLISRSSAVRGSLVATILG